ncbi:MAG TPA: NAD-dependent epimerase/dehydratase family protein, partial [Intrasporangium sp.]|nr:NAD-dependent epimerase/dehydratase family protein [Intrasporangium sp.]
RVVVVGASGNIGSALLDRLSADGHELVGVARRPPTTGWARQQAEWHAIDVTSVGAVEELAGAMRGADAVVHLVFGFQPSHDTNYLRQLDIGGTRASLDAAIVAGVPHFVDFSSLGAYSPRADDDPVDESYPTGGIASLPYSRHKAAVERLLDGEEARGRIAIARMRPALVGHRTSGGALLRYTYPVWAPTLVLRLLPVLPLDRGFRAQFVHVEDLADAVARVLEQKATGAFNIAADGEARQTDVAAALGAQPLHFPWRWLRGLAALTWALRLQPVDPGWLDLAAAVPRMSSERARRELGWSPRFDAVAALTESLDGMMHGAGTELPALRPRSWARGLLDVARRGPVSYRHVI